MATGVRARLAHHQSNPERYKWIALSNTTLGILMATINQSIVIIALPAIFRGIKLNPLIPSNTSYLLWMLLGFMVVGAVLVVSLGRVGDIFGRVRIYNLGFAVFTAGSILLSVVWLQGTAGALWLIVCRIIQGIGGGLPVRQLLGDPHRRLPGRPARPGARHQHGGGDRRLVHRPGAGRRPGPAGLATGVPRVGAGRPVRNRVGLLHAPGAGCPGGGQDRLAGQPHLRRRPDLGAGRDHLRDPALRPPQHGMGQPVGDRRRSSEACSCWGCS